MKQKKMVDSTDVERALDEIKTGADRRYFYENISSPEWIVPLRNRGVFDALPEPVREGDYVQYPDWPEGEYLLRMAEKAEETEVQKLILEVLLDLPETENQRVDRTLTEIALELPPGIALEWAKVERERISTGDRIDSLKADVLAKLAVHIAEGGSSKFALFFMRELLRILPDEENEDKPRPSAPHPEVRMEEWRYGEIVREYVPKLIDLEGVDALDILLCPLLEAAIVHNLSDLEDPDYSWIWRPKIESEERAHQPRDFLTTALLEAVERLADQDSGVVPEIIDLLEGQDPPRFIFRRIILHLMRKYPEEAWDKCVEYALDPDLLGDRRTWHEYALFLEEIFPLLDEEARDELIEEILVGPNISSDAVDELTEEELQKLIENWKLRRLSLIEEHLAGSVAEEYDALTEKHGRYPNPAEPKHGVSSGWVGPTSPKSEEELDSLHPEEVIDYLRNWEPPQEWRSPTPEGLARALRSVVSQDPQSFSNLSDHFRELDPTYISSFITGLEEEGADINWEAVLELCEWVISQPRDAPERPLPPSIYGNDVDPDWGWTRKRIARLLRTGMANNNIPYSLRNKVWGILEELTEDPEPTPEYEEKYGGENMDPHTLSINTVRGEAMHAVIQYALWVRAYELDGDLDKPRTGGFEDATEAREVLDRHLTVENDSSLAIRSVYGQWIPQLFLIDVTWTEDRIDQVFPSETEFEDYRMAAWGGYIFSNPAYDDVFELLRNAYETAVNQLPEGGATGVRKAKERLAEHLMSMYLRGKEPLEGDLISRFFDRADDDLRAYAIRWIGRQIKEFGVDGEQNPGISQRLHDLWDYRLSEAEQRDDQHDFVEEVGAFGWWFISGEFEEEYALRQTVRALEEIGVLKPEFEVIDTLSELSKRHSALALECLNLLVRADEGTKRIYGYKDEETRTILTQGLENDDEELQEKTRILVDYLGAQGFFQFRDLLQPDATD